MSEGTSPPLSSPINGNGEPGDQPPVNNHQYYDYNHHHHDYNHHQNHQYYQNPFQPHQPNHQRQQTHPTQNLLPQNYNHPGAHRQFPYPSSSGNKGGVLGIGIGATAAVGGGGGGGEFPRIIELNVGGSYYSTTLDTLRSDPDSMLCAMFSGRVGVLKDKDGRYFIDRDGPLFRYIINFLRKGTCCLPRTEAERDELREEAEFYQLEGLIKLLNGSQLGVTLGRKALTATKESSGGQKILNDVELALMPFIEEATEAGASSLEIQFGYNHTHAFMEALNKPYQGLKVTPDQSGYKKICDYMKDPVLSRLIMHHFQSRGFSVTYTVSFQSLWMRFDLWESAAYQSEGTRKIEQMLTKLVGEQAQKSKVRSWS